MFQPSYDAKPIGSVAALAATLRVDEKVLRRIAGSASTLYDRFSIDKKDGKQRDICGPRRDLKFLQKRINRQIFSNVSYPQYLTGGIKERDYVLNAEMHSGAKCMIALDIKNFYPHITREHVRQIFKYFCRFPDPVVEILADLTTLDGKVPQGACTSSHLANLVFAQVEHSLVRFFRQRGVVYSRLLDDISISSPAKVFSKHEIDDYIKRVAAMIKYRNMHLKNSKTRITSKSNPETLMEVTGLWLNRGRPRVKTFERRDIRSDVHRVLQRFEISRFDSQYHVDFDRVSGRVAKLTHLEHFEAPKYRSLLRAALPHFDGFDIARVQRQVSSLSNSDASKRASLDYIDRYYKIRYRVNIVRRTDKPLARQLEVELHNCRPTSSREHIVYG